MRGLFLFLCTLVMYFGKWLKLMVGIHGYECGAKISTMKVWKDDESDWSSVNSGLGEISDEWRRDITMVDEMSFRLSGVVTEWMFITLTKTLISCSTLNSSEPFKSASSEQPAWRFRTMCTKKWQAKYEPTSVDVRVAVTNLIKNFDEVWWVQLKRRIPMSALSHNNIRSTPNPDATIMHEQTVRTQEDNCRIVSVWRNGLSFRIARRKLLAVQKYLTYC